MGTRRALCATALAACLSTGSAIAQTSSAPAASIPAAPAGSTGASLSHSALKATTFKVAATITGWFIYSAAAGGVAGGTALTAFTTVGSWLLYTGNDYLWDTYAPPPARQVPGQSFDKAEDAWRTTKKFLTYTPAVMTLAWGSIYVYTGSAATMLTFGAAMTVVKTSVFYANNIAWDYYDWYVSAPGATPAGS